MPTSGLIPRGATLGDVTDLGFEPDKRLTDRLSLRAAANAHLCSSIKKLTRMREKTHTDRPEG